MVSQAGWRVTQVTVTSGPGNAPQRVFRVSWKGYWQADCATTAEVARYVDLTTLVPVGWAHLRSPDTDAAVAEARSRRRQARLRDPSNTEGPSQRRPVEGQPVGGQPAPGKTPGPSVGSRAIGTGVDSGDRP
jgi:hypothetical protein